MKKSFLSLVVVVSILLLSASVVFAKSFSDLTNYQKQKYWSIMSTDCVPLLMAKNYKDYRTCALNALETAAKYQEAAAWCTDNDGGANFTQKGIVQTNIKPNGVADYIYTFPNGKTYLMEGMCSNTNKYYYYIQKSCPELGSKYHPDVAAGACVYVNHAPVLMTVMEKTEINEGEYYEIYLYGTDKDGDNLIFSGENLPEGSIIDENAPVPPSVPVGTKHAVFSWTPTYDQAGEYEVTFKVSDGEMEGSEVIVISVVDKCDSVVNKWDKTFGGSGNDNAHSIQQTNDGGYIVAGGTTSKGAGEADAWVFKLDSDGNLKWDKTFGGSDWDWAASIQQTSDGGYIVAGQKSYSNGGKGSDVGVFKLDSNGNLEWDKTFGGSDYDMADSIQQTSDGGYIIAGGTISKGVGKMDAWILKLDSKGELEWDKTFGGSEIDTAVSIQQTTDGGYIAAGWTNLKDTGNNNAWILKLNSNGDLDWNKTFGGNIDTYAGSIQQTNDGGYIIAGEIGNLNAWVFKLDLDGNLIWDKTFGGSDDWGWALEIQQTTNGGYVVVGKTVSKSTGNEDAWIFKLDSNGNLLWDKTFGGEYGDHAHSIQQTNDGGYIVAAGTNSKGAGDWDAWVLKLDSNGSLECK
ncbi:MAG: hypothetical protein WC604_00860 [Candidatus Gracilibacteria bacterium]